LKPVELSTCFVENKQKSGSELVEGRAGKVRCLLISHLADAVLRKTSIYIKRNNIAKSFPDAHRNPVEIFRP
jgi:hypothetical protein